MKVFYFIFCVTMLYAHQLFSCPTCVGKIKPESPLFFSEESYTTGNGVARLTKEQIGAQEFKKLIESKRGKK